MPSSLKNEIDESDFQLQIPRKLRLAFVTQVLILDGTGIRRLWEGLMNRTWLHRFIVVPGGRGSMGSADPPNSSNKRI